jgi:hypothetical protein
MMAERTVERRKNRRYQLSHNLEPTIEFNHPGPNGVLYNLPVVDLSNAGFAFRINDELTGLEAGSNVDGVVLHMGDIRIEGDLVVIRITPGQLTCGALFYPSSDENLLKLRSLITGIRAGQG